MYFDWKSVLIFIGAAQGLLLGLILLFGRNKKGFKKIFGLLMVMFAIHLSEFGLFRSDNSFYQTTDLFGFRYPIRLSIGPLYYLFTSGLIQRSKIKFGKLALHFTPAVLAFLLLFPLFIMPKDQKTILLMNYVPFGGNYFHFLISSLSVLSTLSMLLYIVMSLQKIVSYQRQSLQFHSNDAKIWISSFLKFTAVCAVVLGGYNIAVFLRQFQVFDASNLFLWMSILLMANLILINITVMEQNTIVPLEMTILEKPVFNESHDALTAEELDRINQTMMSTKFYLDSNLTINDLAEELDMPAYILSRKINKGFGKSFFRYVNEFRIEHAKILLSTTTLKVLAVAYDSGFSNKVSFYRTFKRIEGSTPHEFRLVCKDRLDTLNS